MITFEGTTIFKQLNEAADRCPDLLLSGKLSDMILELGQSRCRFIKECNTDAMIELNGTWARALHLLADETQTREAPHLAHAL